MTPDQIAAIRARLVEDWVLTSVDAYALLAHVEQQAQQIEQWKARAECDHLFEESPIVLDLAPHGIHHRHCARCGRVETWGPEREPWQFKRSALRGEEPSR